METNKSIKTQEMTLANCEHVIVQFEIDGIVQEITILRYGDSLLIEHLKSDAALLIQNTKVSAFIDDKVFVKETN